jgi:hypothetical protein
MTIKSIFSALLLAILMCATPARAFADEAPPGWSTQSNAAGLTAYIAPDQKGIIFVKTSAMPADGSLSTGATSAYAEMLNNTCPNTGGVAPKIALNDRAAQMVVKTPNFVCSVAVGKQNGQLVMVGSIGELSQNVEAMALKILATRIGA